MNRVVFLSCFLASVLIMLCFGIVSDLYAEDDFRMFGNLKETNGPRRDDLGDQLERFDLPYQQNSGLAWDGEHIWGACRTGQRHLFCIDPEDFDVIEDYEIGQSDAIGMTWDPVDGVFWICEHSAGDHSIAYLYDREGENVGEIELPRGGHHGLAWDGEFFYANSENSQNNQLIYRLDREGRVVDEGPNLAALINHGRAVSIEYVPAHTEGHFWVMSTGFISQVAVDFDEGEAEVIQEFQAENTDYPHQGLAHDGYNLWAGGRWSQQLGLVYDDGIEETYGIIEFALDRIEFGPIPVDESVERNLRIYNRAEQEDELHVLGFSVTDLGGDPGWLSFDPEGGEIPANDLLDVIFTAVTNNLDLGEYERLILIESNDLNQREIVIPVHIFVVEGFGQLFGAVTNALNDDPVEGAVIAEHEFGYADTTDEDGEYSFPEIPAWTYDFVVTKEDYLPMPREIEINPDEEVQEDFALLRSLFSPRPEWIDVSLAPNESIEVPLTVSNPGNGPLTWSVERLFPQGGDNQPWDLIGEQIIEEIVEDNTLNGVTFADGQFFISGGNNGEDVNNIYVFDTDGGLVRQFEQFQESRYGMRDLTYDGNLMWGADGSTLYGFNTDGENVETIEGDARSYRALTWDPEHNIFWSADVTSDIFATDLNGDMIREIEVPDGVRNYGLAYYQDDPDGFCLYVFSRGDEIDIQVNKVNLDNDEWTVAAAFNMDGGRPGGIHITNLLDPYNWMFLGLVQGPDRVAVWHLGMREDWLLIDPVEGVVEAGGNEELTVTLNSVGMPDGTEMEADLLFTHDGVGGVFEMPVSLSVTGGGQAQRMLNLEIGWSLVSVNVEPEIEDIVELLAPLVDEGLLIMVKDGNGHFYRPDRGFNNIEGWSGLEGYQFKMAGRGTLRIDGEAFPMDTEIGLGNGWNMVSYLPRVAVDAVDALSNIFDQLEIAKDGRGCFYIPDWDYSNMGLMREGSGYFVKVDGDVNLVYSLGGELMSVGEMLNADDRAWLDSQPVSGFSYSLLLLTEGLEPGTRLEAYTPSGVIAGRGVVGFDGRCGMALWGADQTGEGEHSCPPPYSGFFLEGNEPVIYVVGHDGSQTGMSDPLCSNQTGMSDPLCLDWLDGEHVWTADGWGVARLVVDAAVPVEFGIHGTYPNPFNGQLRIDFALESQGLTTLKAYDLTGREVATLVTGKYSAGAYSYTWQASSLPSGLYLLRLSAGDGTQTRKVLLVR